MQLSIVMVAAITICGSAAGDGDNPIKGIAVSYDLRATGASQAHEFSIVADGEHIRADLSAPAKSVEPLDRIVWTRGSEPIAINSSAQTWFELHHPAPFAPGSRYLAPPLQNAEAKNVRWVMRESPDAPAQRRYTGTLSYDIEGVTGDERVKITCGATIDILTTDRVDRRMWLGQILPITRFENVNETLRSAETNIAGFPLRIRMTATRQYAGGAAMTETIDVETRNVRTIAAPDASYFQRPAGFRFEEPVYGIPGT